MAIVYPQPIQSFRFLIEAGGGISAAFTSFSGVKMQVETLQSRDGDENRGVQEYVPVFTRFDPVTLSKGVVGDNDFMDWILAAAADMESGPTGSKLRRDINVITLNEAGQTAVTWTLKEAMPIGYEMAPLDSSRSEVLMESITFAITGMRRTTAPPGPPNPPWQPKGQPRPYERNEPWRRRYWVRDYEPNDPWRLREEIREYEPNDPWQLREPIKPYEPKPPWKSKRK